MNYTTKAHKSKGCAVKKYQVILGLITSVLIASRRLAGSECSFGFIIHFAVKIRPLRKALPRCIIRRMRLIYQQISKFCSLYYLLFILLPIFHQKRFQAIATYCFL